MTASDLGELLIIVVCLYVIAWFLMIWITVEMARQRGRSQFGWLLAAIFLPLPLFSGFCLFLLGDTDKRRAERLLEEQRYLRKHLSKDDENRIAKKLLEKEDNHSKYYPT